jgi:hypothetical protein
LGLTLAAASQLAPEQIELHRDPACDAAPNLRVESAIEKIAPTEMKARDFRGLLINSYTLAN